MRLPLKRLFHSRGYHLIVFCTGLVAACAAVLLRAHRIGQTRAVEAVRFMCVGTIEERMMALQEKKQLVFEGTVGGETKALASLSEEDLRFLFKN